MRDKKTFILVPLFIILVFYAFYDMQTSAVTGNSGSDRTQVYIALIAIVLYLGIYITLHLSAVRIVNRIQIIILLITGWVLFCDFVNGVSAWNAFLHIGLSGLWFLGYTFWKNYGKKKGMESNLFLKLIFLLFIIYVLALFYYYVDLYVVRGRIPVLNLIYNIIVLVPWLFLIQQKGKRNLIIAISFLAVFVSMKRGAFISFPIMLLAFMLFDKRESKSGKKQFKIILLLITFILGFAIVDYYTGGFISSRFTSESLTDGSGRIDIYSAVINNIKKRSLITLIVGMGSGSTLPIVSTGAHNEWLEFLSSFGIIGVILYLALYYELIKFCIYLKRRKSDFFAICIMMLLYMLIVGMIGGIYFMHSSFFVFSFWGFVWGAENYLKNN